MYFCDDYMLFLCLCGIYFKNALLTSYLCVHDCSLTLHVFCFCQGQILGSVRLARVSVERERSSARLLVEIHRVNSSLVGLSVETTYFCSAKYSL